MAEKRTNEEWLRDLNGGDLPQEAAITDLREILLRAALYFFGRNLNDFSGMNRDDILQLAEDCAQDALISVLQHLQDFRGDSLFTTWAYKFAINLALMSARRERWKGISLESMADSGEDAFSTWMSLDKPKEMAPEHTIVRDELGEVIQKVIQGDLTEKQRQVLSLMVFNEVPMDEVVRHLGTNRNSIYKMLHDARRKVKNGLRERGFEASEVLALFGSSG